MNEQGFAKRLRDEAEAGRAVALLTAEWQDLLAELDGDEDNLGAAFLAAAGARSPEGGAAVAPVEALAIGVCSPSGVLEQADATFARWFGGAADLEPLVREAREGGASLGLVEDGAGDMAAAWAGPAAAAQRWPLCDEAQRALASGPGRICVVVFAPSRSSDLGERVAQAFDLTVAEAKLAQAILFAPSLEIAASQIGIGRETARDTLKRVMAKAGVKRLPALLARLTELMCAASGGRPDEQVLVETFGVTPSEARAAALVAAGATAKQAAEALNRSPETVKSYVKAVLGKTGLRRAKDLSRLLVEARELAVLATVLDPVFESAKTAGRLRVITARDERQVAFIDYGPRSGEVVFVFHGYAAGRTVPPGFIKSLQAQGFRPIVPQRPGFGLTTPAKSDYVATAAADLALLCAELKARDPVILARDGSVAVALAFAAAHPGRANRFVLLNPRTPLSYQMKTIGLVDLFTRGLLGNPKLVAPVTELLRRHSDREMVEGNLRRTCSHAAADIALLEDQTVVEGLVRDIQALVARSAEGFAAEHAIFAAGWAPPVVDVGRFTVLRSTGLPENPLTPWEALPGFRVETLVDAGLLPQFTHAEAMTAAVVGA